MSAVSVRRTCLLAMLWLLAPIAAKAVDCNRPMRTAVEHVELPGQPFAAVPSADGCTIFASLSSATTGQSPGVAVLNRRDGVVHLERVVPLGNSPGGLALTHDGRLLIVANGTGVTFLDVGRMTRGHRNPVLGYWAERQAKALQIYLVVTSDDHYVFVSNEAAGTVNVLDLAAMRRARFRNPTSVATIPVGTSPVGLALSADEQYLFATSQSMEAFGWPKRCRPEGTPEALGDHSEGAIAVIDTKRAITEPGRSVVKWVAAGCSPVRVVASPEGNRVYVTARGSDTLLVFSSKDLTTAGTAASAVRVAVGSAPVGLAVIEGGRKVVVTNSNRFGKEGLGAESLSVIDAVSTGGASSPMLGILPARAFPREIRSTHDGRTLLVTNYIGRSLELIDLERRPWEFALNSAPARDAWLAPAPALALARGLSGTRVGQCCPLAIAAAAEIPRI